MQALTPREPYIVRARFGLDTGAGRTLEDIGQALQLSRERVRQIEAKALEKLRQASCHRWLQSFLENSAAGRGGRRGESAGGGALE